MSPQQPNKGKLIILDRDGVINHDSDDYIKSPEEWFPIEGSAEAIAKLNAAGYQVGVATNQSGIGRGFYDESVLTTIHAKMDNHLAEHNAHIDKLVFCPDHPNNPGPNRKPNPGMALQLLEHFNADPAETTFVGDTISDVKCAIAAGCKPILVKTGKGERTLANPELSQFDIPVFDDLSSYVKTMLG